MKIWVHCKKCFEETGNNALASYPVDIIEEPVLDFTCPNGHNSKYHFQKVKYQFLFESSFRALIDGYYMEAVLGFTASLERFYEFFCKFVCIKNGLGVEGFLGTWKLVTKQSERQLGAFLFLYLLENKSHFDSKKYNFEVLKTFRNKVIHNGYLPSEKETIDYGDGVFEIIKNISVEIAIKDPEFFHSITNEEMFDRKIYKKHPDALSMGMSTFLAVPYVPETMLGKNFREEFTINKAKCVDYKTSKLVETLLQMKSSN